MSTESPRVVLCIYTVLKKLIWVIFCLAIMIAAPQKRKNGPEMAENSKTEFI